MATDFEPLRITAVVAEEVGKPRNDGTRGSGLYAVPFKLSRRPPEGWAELFVEAWNHPPRFSTMHRPGIAHVSGDRIVLDGTTIEEVERHHQETLKLAIEVANEKMQLVLEARKAHSEAEKQNQESHEAKVREVAKRLRFDDQ